MWQPREYFVAAGYSNRILVEVDQAACAADCVPVFRRCSGGGTVLQGPGCLNYALILRHDENERFADLIRCYNFVLERHREMFTALTGATVSIGGTSDLVIEGRKFSGNAQYRKRNYSLVHGTFLLDIDFSRIERYLPMPSKEPAYRQRRTHREFLCNLHLDPDLVKRCVRETWSATEELKAPPPGVQRLVGQRYSRPQWNLKF
jgi:lipoate-protein ligase A